MLGSANQDFVVIQDGIKQTRVGLVDRFGKYEFTYNNQVYQIVAQGDYCGFYQVLVTTLKN